MTSTSWADLIKQTKGQLEPVPAGDYEVRVVDTKSDKSSTGKLMMRVKFEIIEEGPHKGRKIPTQFTLSDDNPMAVAIFFRHMEYMGLGADYWEQLPTGQHGFDAASDALMNRQCRITLAIKPWQGVDRNEVKNVMPSLTSGGPITPGTVTGVATPGGPVAPGASPMPSPTSTPAGPPTPTTDAPPPLPY